MQHIITNPIRTIMSGSWNRYFVMVLIGIFILYSFFVASSVAAINQRKALAMQIREAQTQVSDLEIQYFNLVGAIDANKATELGFVESKTPTFVYTHPESETVALVQ